MEDRPKKEEANPKEKISKAIMSWIAEAWNYIAPIYTSWPLEIIFKEGKDITTDQEIKEISDSISEKYECAFISEARGEGSGLLIRLFKTEDIDTIDTLIKDTEDEQKHTGTRLWLKETNKMLCLDLEEEEGVKIEFNEPTFEDLKKIDLQKMLGDIVIANSYHLNIKEDESDMVTLYAPNGSISEKSEEPQTPEKDEGDVFAPKKEAVEEKIKEENFDDKFKETLEKDAEKWPDAKLEKIDISKFTDGSTVTYNGKEYNIKISPNRLKYTLTLLQPNSENKPFIIMEKVDFELGVRAGNIKLERAAEEKEQLIACPRCKKIETPVGPGYCGNCGYYSDIETKRKELKDIISAQKSFDELYKVFNYYESTDDNEISKNDEEFGGLKSKIERIRNLSQEEIAKLGYDNLNEAREDFLSTITDRLGIQRKVRELLDIEIREKSVNEALEIEKERAGKETKLNIEESSAAMRKAERIKRLRQKEAELEKAIAELEAQILSLPDEEEENIEEKTDAKFNAILEKLPKDIQKIIKDELDYFAWSPEEKLSLKTNVMSYFYAKVVHAKEMHDFSSSESNARWFDEKEDQEQSANKWANDIEEYQKVVDALKAIGVEKK